MTDLIDLEAINQSLKGRSAETVLDWVLESFSPEDVVVSSSFQTQSVPLLHLISQRAPELSVLFLETGFHFPQTLSFRDRLIQQLGLTVRTLKPEEFPPKPTFAEDTRACCALNKTAPLEKVLKTASVWITGVRRDQTSHRSRMNTVERHHTGVLKVHPMLEWTELQIEQYLKQHPQLPQHPLTAQGYSSIGCYPCTAPGSGREGRWPDSVRSECGVQGCPIGGKEDFHENAPAQL